MVGNVLALLAELAAKSGVVLGLAFLAAHLCRRLSAEERHLLWCCALLGILALPVLPQPELGIGIGGFLPAAPTAPGPAAAHEGAPPPPAGSPFAAARVGEARAAAAVTSWQKVALGVYAGVAAVLLGWLALSCARIDRSLRRLTDVAHAPTLALLEAAAARNGLKRRPRAKWSSTDATPLAWGFLRPLIVLPRGFPRLEPEEQRNAIEHEVAHVARWDFLTTSIAWACCAIYWFQPLAWLACRRLVRDSELACDDRVLANGGCRQGYARQLLAIAAAASAAPRGAAPMARRSSVAERITAILDPAKRRRTMSRLQALSILALATALLVPFNGLTAKQGPATEPPGTDHEARARELIAAGHEDEASLLLAEAIATSGAGGCTLCGETLGISQPGPADEASLRVVLRAFDVVEQRARAAGDGNLLIALAELCRQSGLERELERGTWYLAEGFRLGGLSDASKLVALSVLNDLGWYEQAKSLAQALHDDPASSLYRSEQAGRWIERLERRLAHAEFVTGRLIAPHTAAEIEGDVLPLYRQAPAYPPEALAAGKEGEVLLGFTLSETGHPKDIRVLRASDPAFEAPSVNALSEWLFAPRLEGGVAVEQPDQQVTLRYVLLE